jgi:hypothetical protein
MSLMVLSAMLFQTVHSYEHVINQFTEKPCEHHTSANQKEITHSHSVDTKCHICHFSFSTFIPNPFQTLFFQKNTFETITVFEYTKSVSTFFRGSLFALRAPPALF